MEAALKAEFKKAGGFLTVAQISDYFDVSSRDVRAYASANGVPKIGCAYIFLPQHADDFADYVDTELEEPPGDD